MANAATNLEERQEFWKPTVAPRPEVVPDEQPRALEVAEQRRRAPAWLSLATWCRASGLTIASLAALVLGCACIIAAVLTSYVFPAATLVDWQAVQLWRIEWLLAAIAILLAGILLKKK